MSSQQIKGKQSQQRGANEILQIQNEENYSQPNEVVLHQKDEQKGDTKYIDRQQSLDSYLELKYIESGHQNQDEESTLKNRPNIKIQPLVSLDDDSQFPDLYLQPSPKSHKPIEIKIISYRTSTFLGVKTQIFALKITDLNKCPVKQYEIERRFSDFVDLYEQLYFNHPGYILYPFPDKTLQTFIKIKLGIATDSTEKLVLVEKRLSQLQTFVNTISQHKELRNSEQLQIFLAEDPKKFEEGKNKLNKFAEEYKNLSAKSQINNIVGLGKSMLSTYFSNGSTHQQPHIILGTEKKLMIEAVQFVKTEKQKLSKKLTQIRLLLQAEKQFSKIIQINTDADILLKFVAKHNSNKEFSQNFATYLETSLEDQLNILYKKLEEADKNIVRYFNIVDEILNAKNALDLQKKAKLERILQRLEKNFEFDWKAFFQEYKQTVEFLTEDFIEKWKEYKANAQKIWKKAF